MPALSSHGNLIAIFPPGRWRIGDLFVALYEHVLPHASNLLDQLRFASGREHPARNEKEPPLIQEIRQADGGIPSRLAREVVEGVTPERALDLLLAIDEAFSTFARNPDTWRRTRDNLSAPAEKTSSSLAPNHTGRVLLPRWLVAGVPPPAGRGDLRRYFNWVRLVHTDHCVRWRMLSSEEDLSKNLQRVRVGVVPVMDGADAEFRAVTMKGRPFFHVGHKSGRTPRTRFSILERLTRAIERCDEDGVDVLFAPELVCTPWVWSEVARYLVRRATRGLSYLIQKPRWLLLGTALVGGFNRARMLALPHAGRPLWEQDKINPYAMSEEERTRYDLARTLDPGGALGAADLPEVCRPGCGVLWLVDSMVLGRVAIAICEDLAQTPAEHAAALGANVLFVPVMDGPLRNERWALRRARSFEYAGSCVIVANSLVLPHWAYAAPKGAVDWPPPFEYAICRDYVALTNRHPDHMERCASNVRDAETKKPWFFLSFCVERNFTSVC